VANQGRRGREVGPGIGGSGPAGAAGARLAARDCRERGSPPLTTPVTSTDRSIFMPGTESLWYKDAIFYEVYVRGFFDASGDGDGDLLGLTAKLDSLQELGVDCLWLTPIYASPLKDDGYDIAEFRHIHPTIGTVADFEALTKAAHDRGIRIIADLVVNH